MLATQFATMRTSVTRLLPDTCTIQTKTTTSDGAGGWTESWDAVPNGLVPCRLDPLLSRRSLESFGSQEVSFALYQLTVPYDAPITIGCRVLVGSNAYEVRQLIGEHSWRVSRRALIIRLS